MVLRACWHFSGYRFGVGCDCCCCARRCYRRRRYRILAVTLPLFCSAEGMSSTFEC